MTVRIAMPGGDAPEITEADGDWAVLSAKFTRALDMELLRKVRDDVVVSIAPGAGGGAPACFMPDLARIEIDGRDLETAPEDVDPRRLSDRERIPATWGKLVHEAAHARFTDWLPDAMEQVKAELVARTTTMKDVSALMQAAVLLEEPRIEAMQISQRPHDARWLRLCYAAHVAGELDESAPAAAAAQVLCLTGGRQAAGVILPAEGNKVLVAARKIIDAAPAPEGEAANTYRAVTGVASPPYIIRQHQDGFDATTGAGTDRTRSGALIDIARKATGATGATAMLALARAWLAALPAPPPEDEALRKALEAMMGMLDDMAEEIEDEDGFFPEFEAIMPPDWTPVWVPATGAQKNAALRLAKRLEGWLIPDQAGVMVPEKLPPGRLRTRDAIKAAAEDARGAMPEAKPWRRIQRRTIPTPPLRVGIVVDVSGSMSGIAEHSREIAFRLSTAFSHLPDSTLRVMLAGQSIHQMEERPGMIAQYSYYHGCERVDLALKDLTTRLGMLRKGSARLMIVISDAGFNPTEEKGSVAACKRLAEAGCQVLWLDVDHGHGTWLRGALAEIVKGGAIYSPIPSGGTPDEAATMAGERVIEAMKNATAALRRSARAAGTIRTSKAAAK